MSAFNRPGGGQNLNVPPTDQVLSMRQQGLSNNQIVQNLQRAGYATNMIFDAMNQADIKGSIENFPGDAMVSSQPENPILMSSSRQAPSQPNERGQGQGQLFTQAPIPMPSQSMQFGPEGERIEEIAEAIIDEKWKELVRNIDKIIEWKERTESTINKIEQEFADLKKNFESLHNAILGKIGEYDQNIINLGTEIKAMEKVFQKLLPSFTEDVNELSRITKTLKGKK